MEENKKAKNKEKKPKKPKESKVKKVKPKKEKVNKEKPKKEKPKKVKNENKEIQAKSSDTKMKFKYKHPKLALALKIMLIVILILSVIGTGVVIGLIYGLWGDDLKIDITELVLSENSVIVDQEGNVLAELNGDENRKIVTLEEMSPYLPKAYVAIEDERFEKHNGVDIKRTGAAILSFVTHAGKSTAGGGSTITQQLVKNITKDDDTRGMAGVIRKVKEWAKAYQVEKVMSKDQILELYLNLIFIGGKENRGVEIGAEYYFDKTAKDLSIAQCAFLAGINHSPNSYSPYSGKDVNQKIQKRTKTVLSQMKKFNYITQEEYDAAVAEVETGFEFKNGAKGNVYSSHTDALLIQLIKQIMEEKQISKNAAETYLYSSGLKIYSTQVSTVQTAMENEVKEKQYVLKSKKTKDANGNYVLAQGAMVVIEPSTGYVVGCVGQLGEKTQSRGLNRAVGSTEISSGTTRSTGSSFKPLATIIPGLEEGIINPATIYEDSYTAFTSGPNKYEPKNYNGFKGARNIRQAVTTSQNIPFIKVINELTTAKSIEYLRKMGISTLDDEKDSGLSLAIGGLTYGVSVLEMAAAYATIANDGTYIEPTFYSKVEDPDGKIVLEPGQKTERAFSIETAYVTKDLLQSVVTDAGGTATYCSIKGIDVAAKTGTTNDDYDRWLCGFTNYYAGAAWYGFDVQEDVDFSGNPAGKIFAAVMKEIHKGKENSSFARPEGVVSATICRTSGRLATDRCSETYSEIFIKEKLPATCDSHQGLYTVCTESGLLANEFCPDGSKVIKSNKYVVEKERLGLWNTPSVKGSGEVAPTSYCTIHVKQEEVVTPQEPEQPVEKPGENSTPEEPNNSETEKPEEIVKPEEPEKPENPTEGGNTDDGTTGIDAQELE